MQTQPCPYCGRGTAAREWVVTGEQTDYTAPILVTAFFGGCGCLALFFGFLFLSFAATGAMGGLGDGGTGFLGVLCFAFVVLMIWFMWRSSHKEIRSIRWICRTCGAQWE